LQKEGSPRRGAEGTRSTIVRTSSKIGKKARSKSRWTTLHNISEVVLQKTQGVSIKKSLGSEGTVTRKLPRQPSSERSQNQPETRVRRGPMTRTQGGLIRKGGKGATRAGGEMQEHRRGEEGGTGPGGPQLGRTVKPKSNCPTETMAG